MPRMSRCFALVPCAGQGSRAGTPIPKQYALLNGKPVVAHTLDALAAVDSLHQIVVILAPDDPHWDDLALSLPNQVGVRRCGGATRAASVLGGLEALRAMHADERDWVLVHDAARCLVRPGLIRQLITEVREDGVGGLLGMPLADTLKEARDGRVVATVERSGKWLAHTPQMFRLGELERALRAAGPEVTDEASAIEALGLRPLLVASSSDNFKLTYPQDFALAAAVLRSREELMR